jgi:hypothetical protein
MTEIPFVQKLGDAFDVAIAAREQGKASVRDRLGIRAALGVALAIGVLVVTPAIAFRAHVTQLFSDAPAAPERIAQSFAALERGVPRARQTGIRSEDARKVLDVPIGFDKRAVVWLAPRRNGGFCTLLELQGLDGRRTGHGGECVPLMKQLSFETSVRGTVSPTGEILTGPVLIDGRVGLAKADSVELAFEDGTSVPVTLVWVTAPVNTGFFVYSVPPAHWRVGHLPTRLFVRDAEGAEIGQATVTGIDLRAAYADD